MVLSREMQVLEYLKKHKTITSAEAFKEFGYTRLSAGIFLLKKRGYNITCTRVDTKNAEGRHITYGVYTLKE